MLKIAICDDDLYCIEIYSQKLLNIAKKHQIKIEITSYTSGEALVFDWAKGHRQADALYLDIHMDGISGMQAARELREMGCRKEIVFFTYDKEQVYDAFDVDAFHYIVKEVTTDKRFEEIFLQLAGRLKKKQREYVTFSFGGENRDLALDEIKYFQVDVRVVTVHYGKDESFDFYSTIGKLETLLCSKGFIRTHRSVLVNISHIKSANYQEVLMQDGARLPVGRSYWQSLKEAMPG